MKALINGSPVSESAVSVRDRKFGADAAGARSVDYALQVPVDDAVRIFSGYYDDYVDDARRFQDEGEPIEVDLRRLGWPSFEELAAEHGETWAAFIQLVEIDFLRQLFVDLGSSAQSAEPSYFINSVESAEVADGMLTLRGIAIDTTR